MIENRELFRLSDIHIALIDRLARRKGIVYFLDPRNYIRFDIFYKDIDELVV